MNEADTILIEKYIQGVLTAKERMLFENRLANEASLSEAYQSTLAAYELINIAGRTELKNKLKSFQKNNSKSKKSLLSFKYFYYAAALFILLIGSYVFNNYLNTMNSSQVFKTYFKAYPAPSVLRGNDTIENVNWNSAILYYEQENYKEAIANFEKTENTIPQYKVDFYKAICYLQWDDTYLNSAINSFKKISQQKSDFQEQALWYYGLALLKDGDITEATKTFEFIVENKTFNYKLASEILKIRVKD
ncbi:hypothetical protein K8089_01385 [Aequorivita sp. F47161]|uniref:Tetratricopeptide repeat protein n=1 Tax=Aequorivita vitellina TaxID=2874475 RepID=A0A9X1QQX2_9FLAO|nr:hypothetical protein [Aequorivita vitellina]MCG2417656.1 hypothetical protein [Aequorivita vitellina]